jgi:hypothetical protein
LVSNRGVRPDRKNSMKTSILSRALLATGIALATPLAANAAPTAPAIALASSSAPIVVRDVNVQPTGAENSGPGFVSLAFTNTSNVAANEVWFALGANGRYDRRIHDVGTFAPGVAIRHAYFDNSGASNQAIKVVKVQFADGTTWTNPDQNWPHSRRQAT